MDPEAMAKQFVDFYYHTFDTNNPSFVSLYHSTRTPPCSPLRTPKIQGAAAIAAKLTGLHMASSISPVSSTRSSSRRLKL